MADQRHVGHVDGNRLKRRGISTPKSVPKEREEKSLTSQKGAPSRILAATKVVEPPDWKRKETN